MSPEMLMMFVLVLVIGGVIGYFVARSMKEGFDPTPQCTYDGESCDNIAPVSAGSRGLHLSGDGTLQAGTTQQAIAQQRAQAAAARRARRQTAAAGSTFRDDTSTALRGERQADQGTGNRAERLRRAQQQGLRASSTTQSVGREETQQERRERIRKALARQRGGGR